MAEYFLEKLINSCVGVSPTPTPTRIYSRFNEISEILLDILPSEDLSTSDDSGITPLMLECQFPEPGPIAMKLLSKLSLEQIRKVDNNGTSAFDYAQQRGCSALIQAFETKLGLETGHK